MSARTRWRFWLWLGLTSFGGPGAQIASLRAEVVERRGWLTAEQFGRALALCFFLPGPEAQQMVAWTAWKLDGWRSALMASLAFILPGLCACAALGYAYVSYGHLPSVEAALVGVRAVVAGILFVSAWRIGASARQGVWPGLSALGAFVGLVWGIPFGVYALTVGGLGWGLTRAEPTEAPAPALGIGRRLAWGLLPFVGLLGIALACSGGWVGYGRLAGVSAFAVLTSFGGAYAALSLWRTQADAAGWLPAGRFGDALVVGEITPGPLMLAGSFVGFVAGHQGLLGGGAGWGQALAGLIIPAVFTFGVSTAMILATAPLGEVGVASVRFRAATDLVVAAAAGALAWMGAMMVVGAGGRPLPVVLTLAAVVVAQYRLLGVTSMLAVGALCGWWLG